MSVTPIQEPPPATAPPQPRPRTVAPKKRATWPYTLIVLGLAGFAAYHWWPAIAALTRGGKQAASKPAPRPTSVLTAVAKRGDMPIYLDGLGTVTAYKMVVVRSRVEGQLVKVNFDEGQMVKKDSVIAEVDVRPFQADLDNKLAALQQAEAQVDLALVTYNRIRDMPEDTSSPIEVQTSEATLKQARALVAAARAAVDSAKLNVEWCRITAPITGKIGLRQVDQGNLVHLNDVNGVATIAQVTPISVIFNLPQDELPQVLAAMKNEPQLIAEAHSSDFTRLIASGKLEAVDNQIDPGTGTARLKATFSNEDNALYPNQFVNVRLLVETRRNVVLIPTAGVQLSPTTQFVYVVKNGSKVEMRPVKAGHAEHGKTIIESGLEADEVVVIDGVDKLQPGSAVTIRTPATSSAPAKKNS